MQYKKMPTLNYIMVTLLIFILQITGGIFINDLGLIFEFLAAFSISSLNFIFPGAFFLLAERRFATTFKKSQNTWVRF